MSRSGNSLRNVSVAFVGQIFGLIVSFISRFIFIKILGSEYLGINGLFTNILTILSLAELGVGEAITFSLYKPLAKNDTAKCQMLMQFYKKVYTIIGVVILIVGVSITPLLPVFIKDMPDISNINFIYVLFVINTSISYFFSYKKNLIIADQNRYIATIFRYSFYFLLNVVQIIYLMIFRDYIGFLILQIGFTLLENFCISIKAEKMYPYLKDSKKIKLDNKSKNEIFKNTKAMMMHKIGGVVVTSTDNILLSSLVNLNAVGLYSNYYLVINALNTIFLQLFTSLNASVGNLCINEDTDRQYDIFKKVNFACFWIFGFSSICLICLFNPFIELWVGKDYLFSIDIVLILVINYFITGMRRSVLTFREATGLFYRDRWKAIIEAVVNLVVSILLAKRFGTLGVFLGTFISSITVCVWVEPYILYKYAFKRKLSEYFKIYFKYLITIIIVGIVTYLLCSFINFSPYVSFICKILISLIFPNFILFVIFSKSCEFKYFSDIIFKFAKKILKIKK